MTIDIVITAYHMHDRIGRALSSVAMQGRQEDIRVTIIDDCDDTCTYDDIVEDYRPVFGDRLRLLRKPENTGCGQSRQYGIDHTDCSHIMFLDADDTFASPFSIDILASRAEKYDADIVSSSFVEEAGEELFLPHVNDRTWMHGKLYKVSFIKYHDIRFNFSRANEDSAFNTMCYSLCSQQVHVDFITYVWMNNPNSITRSEEYLKNTICIFIENAQYACEELIKRRVSPEKITDIIVSYLTSMYGYYCRFLLEKKDNEFMNNYQSVVNSFISKTNGIKFYEKASEELKSYQFFNNPIVSELINSEIIFPIGFSDFLKIMGGLV